MTRPTSPMGSSSEPGHEMRITSGGSIDNYVKFATDFLLVSPPSLPLSSFSTIAPFHRSSEVMGTNQPG